MHCKCFGYVGFLIRCTMHFLLLNKKKFEKKTVHLNQLMRCLNMLAYLRFGGRHRIPKMFSLKSGL